MLYWSSVGSKKAKGGMRLQASGLGCVRGARRLFGGVAVTLAAGDALRVAGPNGSGKSTLLRTLCGLSPADEGSVRWDGSDVRSGRAEFAAQLTYLGHAPALKEDLSAAENLHAAAALAGGAVDAKAVAHALGTAGLARLAAVPCRLLSEGQRKRVSLARLQLSPRRALWVLDEPFSSLDAPAIGSLVGLIRAHLGQGGLLVYTTHDEIEIGARALHLGSPC